MQTSKRRLISVKLTDAELARSRELASKYYTLSTHIFTLAIRAVLTDEKYLLELLDRDVWHLDMRCMITNDDDAKLINKATAVVARWIAESVPTIGRRCWIRAKSVRFFDLTHN